MKTFDVISIGAALVDMIASVERYPLEDDEVYVSDLKVISGGAAANTAYACAKLGLNTAFIGKIGEDDAFGQKIIYDFKSVSVNISLIKHSTKVGTGSAYVALNKTGDRRIYAYSGAANELSKEDINEKELTLSKVIFLSSLRNIEPFLKAAKTAREHNICSILNPGMLIIEQGFDKISRLLKYIDILIISKREYCCLMGLEDLDLDATVLKEIPKVFQDLGILALIITLGSEGAFLLTCSYSKIIPPRKVDKVVDTTGAGDAFSAGFIYGFNQNPGFEIKKLERNIKIGCIVATCCIQSLGARNGLPGEKEIKKLLM
ncbi:MAG: carbohydrate kinase family protein [Candidatus Lokiarchaeota archaeon]|nr:carbohydrate kinase family protein [Candidatus Lokiarchaeota archaeon]